MDTVEFKKPKSVKKSKDLQRKLLEKLEADSQAWFSRLKKSLEDAEAESVASESGIGVTDSEDVSDGPEATEITTGATFLPPEKFSSIPSSGYASLASSDAEVDSEDGLPVKIMKMPDRTRDVHSQSLLADYPGSLLEQTRREVAKMSVTLTPHEFEAAKDFESFRIVENVMNSPLVKRPASPESPLYDRYNTLSSLQDEEDFDLEFQVRFTN